jgi:hypothetical protein
MKKVLLLAVFCAVTCISKAQIATDEKPYGLLMKEGKISTQSVSSVQEKVKTFTAVYKTGIVQTALKDNKI